MLLNVYNPMESAFVTGNSFCQVVISNWLHLESNLPIPYSSLLIIGSIYLRYSLTFGPTTNDAGVWYDAGMNADQF